MVTLIPTNTISWGNYSTDILTEKTLKEFLMSEAIPCLSSRFKNPEEFYQNILFKIPETKNHNNYKFIYSHLIEYYPHNYLEKEKLAKKYNLEINSIIAEGSVRLMDTSKNTPPMVRWLIVKK